MMLRLEWSQKIRAVSSSQKCLVAAMLVPPLLKAVRQLLQRPRRVRLLQARALTPLRTIQQIRQHLKLNRKRLLKPNQLKETRLRPRAAESTLTSCCG